MSILINGNPISQTNFNSGGEVKSIFYLPDDGLVLNLNATNYQNGSGTWCDSAYGMCFNSRNSGEPYTTTPTSKTVVDNLSLIHI